MLRAPFVTAAVMFAGVLLSAQAPDRELVASVTGPELAGGIVSGLAWDGGTLIIQTAAAGKGGALTARYHVVAGRGMTLRPLPQPPPSVERYWKRKASRTSPTGLGTITIGGDSKMPMYGISSQEKRFSDAIDMGGIQTTHVVRVNDLVIHRRRDVEPYDGEVWSWSPAEINRVAYVDEKGDLWTAQADGRGAERLAKGHFTLPAWSEDGKVIAVAERKNGGRTWDVFVIHLPEKARR